MENSNTSAQRIENIKGSGLATRSRQDNRIVEFLPFQEGDPVLGPELNKLYDNVLRTLDEYDQLADPSRDAVPLADKKRELDRSFNRLWEEIKIEVEKLQKNSNDLRKKALRECLSQLLKQLEIAKLDAKHQTSRNIMDKKQGEVGTNGQQIATNYDQSGKVTTAQKALESMLKAQKDRLTAEEDALHAGMAALSLRLRPSFFQKYKQKVEETLAILAKARDCGLVPQTSTCDLGQSADGRNTDAAGQTGKSSAEAILWWESYEQKKERYEKVRADSQAALHQLNQENRPGPLMLAQAAIEHLSTLVPKSPIQLNFFTNNTRETSDNQINIDSDDTPDSQSTPRSGEESNKMIIDSLIRNNTQEEYQFSDLPDMEIDDEETSDAQPTPRSGGKSNRMRIARLICNSDQEEDQFSNPSGDEITDNPELNGEDEINQLESYDSVEETEIASSSSALESSNTVWDNLLADKTRIENARNDLNQIYNYLYRIAVRYNKIGKQGYYSISNGKFVSLENRLEKRWLYILLSSPISEISSKTGNFRGYLDCIHEGIYREINIDEVKKYCNEIGNCFSKYPDQDYNRMFAFEQQIRNLWPPSGNWPRSQFESDPGGTDPQSSTSVRRDSQNPPRPLWESLTSCINTLVARDSRIPDNSKHRVVELLKEETKLKRYLKGLDRILQGDRSRLV